MDASLAGTGLIGAFTLFFLKTALNPTIRIRIKMTKCDPKEIQFKNGLTIKG